jgi:hypothetical protein
VGFALKSSRPVRVESDAFNLAILDVNNTDVRVEGWVVRIAKNQSSVDEDLLVVKIYPPDSL